VQSFRTLLANMASLVKNRVVPSGAGAQAAFMALTQPAAEALEYHERPDEDLVSAAKSGDNLAMEFLLNKYKNFVRIKAKSYFLIGADREDIIQEGMIGLYKAVRDFKADKLSSFRAFAELCITRQIITAIKTATRFKHSPLNSYVSFSHTPAGQEAAPAVPALRGALKDEAAGTRQAAALAEAAALDGRYLLGTNLTTGSPTDRLAQAKRRDVPEKRFALIKGPLAVRPIFVHQQQRILALVWCTMVALLLYALLEWEARRVGQPQTGQVLFRWAATLRVVLLSHSDGSSLRLLTGLDPNLAALLDRFG